MSTIGCQTQIMLLYGSSKVSILGMMKLNFVKSTGKVTFETVSTKVLPRHMRMPPKKGLNANGLRFSPLGVRKYLFFESNRSGMNESGSIH